MLVGFRDLILQVIVSETALEMFLGLFLKAKKSGLMSWMLKGYIAPEKTL